MLSKRILRSRLVHPLKYMFLIFKQHYTYFHILFHLHIFSHMFSNNKTHIFKCICQNPLNIWINYFKRIKFSYIIGLQSYSIIFLLKAILTNPPLNYITRISIYFFTYTYFHTCFQTTKHMFSNTCTKHALSFGTSDEIWFLMFGMPNVKNFTFGTPNVNALRSVKSPKIYSTLNNNNNKKCYIQSAKPKKNLQT